MNCSKCNSNVPNDSKFCPTCGIQIQGRRNDPNWPVLQQPSVPIAERIEKFFEWVLENWLSAVLVIIVISIVLGFLKDAVMGLAK